MEDIKKVYIVLEVLNNNENIHIATSVYLTLNI